MPFGPLAGLLKSESSSDTSTFTAPSFSYNGGGFTREITSEKDYYPPWGGPKGHQHHGDDDCDD